MITALLWILFRLRLLVLPAWIAVAALAAIELPGLAEGASADISGLVPRGATALDVERRSARAFEAPLHTRVAVVQRDRAGLPPAHERRAFELAAAVGSGDAPAGLEDVSLALPVTNAEGIAPGSREPGTTVVTLLFLPPELSVFEQADIAQAYAAELEGASLVGVTGAVPARAEEWRVIDGALWKVEAATLALIAIVLAIAFRSLGAPLLVLSAAVVAYVVATRLTAWAGAGLGIAVPQEVEPVVVVLLLGIMTDYAIFFLAGFRRRLAEGMPRVRAAEETARQYTPIVGTAGLIVGLGTATLLLGRLDFFRAFGPGMALAVLVTLAVALTFVPAALAIFGRLVFWPSRLVPDGAGPGSWRRRAARLATRRPVSAVLAVTGVAALAVAAGGLARMDLGFTLIAGLPGDSEVRGAAGAAEHGFAPGLLAPTELLVEAPGLGGRQEALAALQGLLAREEGVAAVIGPREQPPRVRDALFRTEDAARYAIVLRTDPLSAAAIADVDRLEQRLPGLLAEAGLGDVRAGLGGDTALARETVNTMLGDMARIGLAALLVNFLLLALFLRALFAPLYLLAASALALAATLGLTALVFGELTYYVPLAAAVLLLSLGSDYNVIIVGRIWQEADRLPVREAVAFAAPRAARAIGTAGIVLALSFALLALVPLRPFREFAFAMFVGVLLDSFLVRTMLVPSLISLAGRWSWWPSRRAREAPAEA